jgi:hypothetical protein
LPVLSDRKNASSLSRTGVVLTAPLIYAVSLPLVSQKVENARARALPLALVAAEEQKSGVVAASY